MEYAIEAGFRLPGQLITKPDGIVFSGLIDRKYADRHEMAIFGEGKLLWSGDTSVESNVVGLVLKSVPMDYATYLKMISAREVKLVLGPDTFLLKPEDIEALKDLSKVIDE